jgi:hypothetical protein
MSTTAVKLALVKLALIVVALGFTAMGIAMIVEYIHNYRKYGHKPKIRHLMTPVGMAFALAGAAIAVLINFF